VISLYSSIGSPSDEFGTDTLPVMKRDRSHASEFVRQIRVDKIREEIEGKRGIFYSEDETKFIYI
jgi:hypothetical protein